ncbi:proline-rich protein 7 [Latimeria chalumnae]|uniref:proline-rich protein 7 n=1 Tax=Latimeria chalumnae TaxID=7897 RepID=UPI0003C183CA|nr:PREDICTED: proline-rich protein 7 [Latimeria chalumnae]XP_014341819.1 PREDICTED: proline-rich protein 7 [Latimeria chalumnae]XP_014341820.1 PREDICTED: proline-rich protein 7 [Latimeria chalumnae]XP_014341821.1 PREDICTED: proline-rich protein 7 [Latimeria chalumnae]|eukprot:XP_005992433.1 PREDICTED: proline-rich protein 7 [Latimeria chalumnae]
MVMSHGTYTFLTCFAGFWLIWALIVMLCCFCSFVRRRLKHRQEERLREQTLRTVEMDPLHCERFSRTHTDFSESERPQIESHHSYRDSWTNTQDLSKPPRYEEAVLMSEPPPSYSEVLSDDRGVYRTVGKLARRQENTDKSKHLYDHKALYMDIPYSSFMSIPSMSGEDSVSLQLTEIDFNQSNFFSISEDYQGAFSNATDSELSRNVPEQLFRIPFSIPILGRTTAV